MRWKILNKRKSQNVIKVLLANRGIKTKKAIKEFLNPKNPEDLTPKNILISSKEMSKTITRVKKAIKNKEKIIVYGDYDTDGVCATAIMWETLDKLGAKVMPFIPQRSEGYGLKVNRIKEMAKNGIKLIITVDQGILAIEPVKNARKLGIDVIITDHHLPGKKRPKALAIIHTTQLSGTGVAWFLAKYFNGKSSLDLATIGTISDVVPLLGANRSLVKFGINELRKTSRPGLLALFELAGINKDRVGTFEVGYILGPRLNAAGRIDDPMDSLRLVCTRDKQRASVLAQKLDQKNRQRQDLMGQTFLKARKLWLKQDGKSALIFVSHESYQEGIVGLVAGKLMEEFYRPAIVVSRGKEFSRASARSIEEFNIIEAIRTCADILGPHGGHPRAAGFSIETTKIELLKTRLVKLAEEQLDKDNLSPTLKIDMELDLNNLNFKFYEKIAKLGPYGEGNPQPVFMTRNVKVIDAKTVGSGSRHLKLRLTDEKSRLTFNAIGFGIGELYSRLSPDKPIKIAYNLLIDEWSGQKQLQLKIKDIK